MFTEKNTLNFIDLFSGAGGLSEGFFNHSFNPIAHVEMNTYASETLKTRSCYYYLKKTKQLDVYRDYLKGTITKEELYDYVPEEVIHTVINSEISDKTYKNIFHEIDAIMEENGVTHVDVIIGGPPCQAYSLVGRASDPNGMENDPRNDLYIQYARFLNKYKPKMFVFENVPGMLTAKKGVIMEENGVTHVDVIIGGPPCQAYSLVGRASDPNGMENDPRNDLYIQYARFLNKYKPKMFVFENVPGMLTAKKGVIWKRIQQRLRTVGYDIEYREVYANDFGVLQRRKRIIIIGWRKDLDLYYPEFRHVEYNATVNDILNDLAPLTPGETNNEYNGEINDYLELTGIRKQNDILTDHQTRRVREVDRDIYRIAIEMWNDNHKRMSYNDLPQELQFHRNNTSFLDRYKVVEGDMPYAHTMLAHISKDGHYYIHPDAEQCRSLSVREAARIQSFPDDFYFEGPRTAKFVQIGNAVPPLMANAIAEAIKEELNRLEEEDEST